MPGVAGDPRSVLVAGRGSGDPAGAGLYRYRRDERGAWDGELLDRVDELAALARHPHLPVVYGVAGADEGWLIAWRLEGRRATRIDIVSSGGREPCHVAVSADGGMLVVCNYSSSRITVVDLCDDGSFGARRDDCDLQGGGPDVERQGAAHPHQAVFDADGSHITVVDLGADLMRRFRVERGGVTEFDQYPLPPGSGPRHLASREGVPSCVSGELGSVAIVLPASPEGPIRSVPSTRRTGPAQTRSPRNYPGDVQIHPSAPVAYVANRGYDTIAVIGLDADPTLLDEVDAGAVWPQHLLATASELLVAGSDDSRVISLPVDDRSGRITGSGVLAFECPGASWLVEERPA